MRDPKEVLAEELFSNIYPSSRSMPKSVLAYDKQFKAIFNAIEEAYEVGKKEREVEVLEQARLLGISGSKEAALEARLKEANEKLLGKDMAIYGTAWMKDGKRIDPNDVYKSPLEMELENKLADAEAAKKVLREAVVVLEMESNKWKKEYMDACKFIDEYEAKLTEALRLGDLLEAWARKLASDLNNGCGCGQFCDTHGAYNDEVLCATMAWQAFRSSADNPSQSKRDCYKCQSGWCQEHEKVRGKGLK